MAKTFVYRIMYFTDLSASGSINRAGMDGSNPVKLVSRLNYPAGITIDVQNSRLYWTCYGDDKIKSSDLQGRNVQTVLRHRRGSNAWGIGLTRDRIYFTDWSTKKLWSITKTGLDVQLLHIGTTNLLHVSMVPRSGLPRSRTNHCKNHACSKVCVLTQSSFRCLA